MLLIVLLHSSVASVPGCSSSAVMADHMNMLVSAAEGYCSVLLREADALADAASKVSAIVAQLRQDTNSCSKAERRTLVDHLDRAVRRMTTTKSCIEAQKYETAIRLSRWDVYLLRHVQYSLIYGRDSSKSLESLADLFEEGYTNDVAAANAALEELLGILERTTAPPSKGLVRAWGVAVSAHRLARRQPSGELIERAARIVAASKEAAAWQAEQVRMLLAGPFSDVSALPGAIRAVRLFPHEGCSLGAFGGVGARNGSTHEWEQMLRLARETLGPRSLGFLAIATLFAMHQAIAAPEETSQLDAAVSAYFDVKKLPPQCGAVVGLTLAQALYARAKLADALRVLAVAEKSLESANMPYEYADVIETCSVIARDGCDYKS